MQIVGLGSYNLSMLVMTSKFLLGFLFFFRFIILQSLVVNKMSIVCTSIVTSSGQLKKLCVLLFDVFHGCSLVKK